LIASAYCLSTLSYSPSSQLIRRFEEAAIGPSVNPSRYWGDRGR
jgi:hypothetical protein